ncbi:MAG: permease [Nanoarchaeota archaeon]|nr:permease [Nanoarchaeota archaeon]MBU1004787.1 permease [Nanoarchaeota archaeon]MBU1945543.1 permease [Nanoarchaeota archaeon]
MIEEFVESLIVNVFKIGPGSKLAESLNFFIYDSIKIIILLFVMIFLIGILRSYLPTKKIKKYLTGKKAGIGNVLAATFGAITPFCSCSSIPIFIGFIEAEIPLGISFSFLITSPLVNEYMAVIMLGVFGWKITLYYILAGILIGIIGGIILGNMKLEKNLVKDIAIRAQNISEKRFKLFKDRIRYGYDEAISIVKKVWLYVLIGVGIGAILHGYVPQEYLQDLVSKTGLFSVPLATLLGIPLYANCAAIIPIALVLVQKGIPLGTAMAFMMATAALSLPEAVILRRVMNLKLIGIFFGIVGLSIVVIGYLFNFLV